MKYDMQSIQKIRDILVARQKTVAVAESVTGGQLQAAFSLAMDASLFFQGGITAYNAHQKYTQLHIDIVHAIQCNCVSQETAEEMALGVCRLFGSEWGISTTGYAAPLESKPEMQLYLWYAIAYKGKIVKADTITAEHGDPLQIQLFYVNAILQQCCQCFIKKSEMGMLTVKYP